MIQNLNKKLKEKANMPESTPLDGNLKLLKKSNKMHASEMVEHVQGSLACLSFSGFLLTTDACICHRTGSEWY